MPSALLRVPVVGLAVLAIMAPSGGSAIERVGVGSVPFPGRIIFYDDPCGDNPSPGVLSVSSHGARCLIPAGGNPHLSRDGKLIAFQAILGDSVGIFVARADGTHRRLRGRGILDDLSANGARIAFHHGAERGRRVFVVPTSGRGLRRVGREGDAVAGLSPDGRYLALLRGCRYRGGACGAELLLYRASGRLVRRIGSNVSDACCFSPDGRKILVWRKSWLYAVRIGRASQQRLAGGEPYSASWSPDGRAIAYEIDCRVFLVGANGRGRSLLRTLRTAYCPSPALPTWSPDGGTIAYVVGGRIALMRRSGGPQRIVYRKGTDPGPLVWTP